MICLLIIVVIFIRHITVNSVMDGQTIAVLEREFPFWLSPINQNRKPHHDKWVALRRHTKKEASFEKMCKTAAHFHLFLLLFVVVVCVRGCYSLDNNSTNSTTSTTTGAPNGSSEEGPVELGAVVGILLGSSLLVMVGFSILIYRRKPKGEFSFQDGNRLTVHDRVHSYVAYEDDDDY